MTLCLPAWILVRRDGPKRKLWKNCKVIVGPKKGYVSFFDGLEIGSTGVEKTWRLPG